MRWSFLVVAGCFIALSLPAHAGHFILRVSKPNGGWSAYLDDSAACRSATSLRGYIEGPEDIIMGQPYSEAEWVASESRYWDCMVARGYRANPNGYRAA